MLPPPINVIRHYMDTDGKGRDDVFAIVQFNGDDLWHQAAWSVPLGGDDDDVDDSNNHAEARLVDYWLLRFINQYDNSHEGELQVCAITLKYSPCPDCGENKLRDVVRILQTAGINDYHLYYLEEYRGDGGVACYNGIKNARGHFGANVNLYDNISQRRRQWPGIRDRYKRLGKI